MPKQNQNFNGYFTQHCERESIPDSLLLFLHMLTGSLYDPASKMTSLSAHIPALSIAQLIQFNIVPEQRTSRLIRMSGLGIILTKRLFSIYMLLFGFILILAVVF